MRERWWKTRQGCGSPDVYAPLHPLLQCSHLLAAQSRAEGGGGRRGLLRCAEVGGALWRLGGALTVSAPAPIGAA